MSEADLAARIIDSANATFGVHTGRRAVHAKGVLCSATFRPTAEAAELSRAAHFRGPPVRAHVRFSNSSGDPSVADGAPGGRGMAVKFYLDASTTDLPSTTDLLGSTSPAFVARTPEDFLAFGEARRPDPATGVPDAEKFTAYLAEHPEALPAVEAAMTQGVPASYTTLSFHSLHAFAFESSTGEVRAGRYHLLPESGEHHLSPEDAAAQPADFLTDELASRLDRAPAAFVIRVELAAPGDPIDDPTAVWPPGRDTIDVGRLEISALAFDRERDGDILVFDPTRVTDGIALTDDPILHARQRIYGESVARRTAN